MIDITFDEIGEHIEKGDLKAWLSELKVVDAMKHLRMYEPQIDKWSHDCIGCGNNDTCEFAFTDAVKICKYVKTNADQHTYEPLTCRNKDHYADCEYKDNCNPVVCFKALDEFREMMTEPQERSE